MYCPFYFIEVENKQIGVIEVPSGKQKPYTVSGAIFIRLGANSQKITSVEQMRDFFQQAVSILMKVFVILFQLMMILMMFFLKNSALLQVFLHILRIHKLSKI